MTLNVSHYPSPTSIPKTQKLSPFIFCLFLVSMTVTTILIKMHSPTFFSVISLYALKDLESGFPEVICTPVYFPKFCFR